MGESVRATSSLTETLGGKSISYGPENLFDQDISASWVEGADGPGLDESVLIQTELGCTRYYYRELQLNAELTLLDTMERQEVLLEKWRSLQDDVYREVITFFLPGIIPIFTE